MRICVMLKCTAPTGKKGDPRVISRWDKWPCKLSIGETYHLWDGDDGDIVTDDDGTFKVRDVLHKRVRRNLWERLLGKPTEVTVVMFETDDPELLRTVPLYDRRWKIRDDFPS